MTHSSIPIIYQDDSLVVVNKPSGLLVHRSEIDRHETEFLMQRVRDQINQHVYTVHRLDRPTSGVMVLALSSDIARQLSVQFSEREVSKYYQAIVRGHVKQAQWIDHPLKEELDKLADKMARENKPAQVAQTYITPLATHTIEQPVGRYPTARYSLVGFLPKTGRKHQLRRHAAHIRHPILVDSNHGDNKHNRFFRESLSVQRLMLHARGIRFRHPLTGTWMQCIAGYDGTWLRVLHTFGWSQAIHHWPCEPEMSSLKTNTPLDK